jgi:Mg/Co/Ni transporter MgtE
MSEKRRVQLTLKVYADIVLPVMSDEDAEDIINNMDIKDLIAPINGLEIDDGIIEIESFDVEYGD